MSSGLQPPVRGVNTAAHDVREYVRALVTRLAEEASSPEEEQDTEVLSLIADKALLELRSAGKAAVNCCDRVVSRQVEQLVQFCSLPELSKLAESLSAGGRDGVSRLAIHSIGSHALESVICALGDFCLSLRTRKGNSEDADVVGGIAALQVLARDLAANVTDVMADTYGSRVLRVLIRILAGQVSDLDRKQQQAMRRTWRARGGVAGAASASAFNALAGVSDERLAGPPALQKLLRDVLNAMWGVDLPAACWNAAASPVLQVALKAHAATHVRSDGDSAAISIVSELSIDEVVRRTLMWDRAEREGNEHVALLSKDAIGSHWLPAVFEVCSDVLLAEAYTRHFRSQLDALAQDPRGNYVVQGLLQHARDVVQFGMMFDELIQGIAGWFPTGGQQPSATVLGVLSVLANELVKRAEGRSLNEIVKRQELLWKAVKAADSKFIEHAWMEWKQGQGAACNSVTAFCKFRPSVSAGKKSQRSNEDAPSHDALKDFISVFNQLVKVPVPMSGAAAAAAAMAAEAGDVSQQETTNVAPIVALLTSHGLPVMATFEHVFGILPVSQRDDWAKRMSKKPQRRAVDAAIVKLASSTASGSKLVQHIYAGCSVSGKRAVATVLGDAAAIRSTVNQLTTTRHGRLCLQVCRVQQLQEHEDSWKEAEEANLRKRKMFKDLFEDDDKEHAEDSGAKRKAKKVRDDAGERDEIDDLFATVE